MDLIIETSESEKQASERNKGNSIIALPSDFVILDLETTGLDPSYDNIIEIGILKIRNNEIADNFSTLINPGCDIPEYITELTGITNEILSSAPFMDAVAKCAFDFIGSDVVIGHNINFDINFLYDNFENILGVGFQNDYIDTLRFARKLLPQLERHRLVDLCEYYKIKNDSEHRALGDCYATLGCYGKLRSEALVLGSEDDFKLRFKKHHVDLRKIEADETAEFDETNPLYAKRCVFTGVLEKMQRADAAKLVLNKGGFCDNGVTVKTNYLILGNNDYCKSIKGGKSSKQIKAEKYKAQGLDIEIIPENVFYDMLERY